jgi:hypothetical protein
MVYGGSFWEGLRGGAVAGGVTAGIIWGYRDYNTSRALEKIKFDSSQADVEQNLGEEDGSQRYAKSNGKIDRVIQDIREYGQSPTGARVLGEIANSREGLWITAEWKTTAAGTLEPSASIGGNIVSYNGGKGGIAIAHEFSHTTFGGGYSDCLTCDGYRPGNALAVAAENKYRSWIGIEQRPMEYPRGGPGKVDSFSLGQRIMTPW